MSEDPFESLFRVGRSSRFSPALDPSWVPQEGEASPDGMQPSGWIEDGVISDASFAASIDPVLLRTTAQLTNADAAAFPNRVAFNTDDKKLYRSSGTAWTAAVPATDMTGQITTTQITDLAISTPKLAAGAVTAAKITAGTITANEIAADTITAGQIAAGAISTSELAAGAVSADKLSVGGGRYLTNPDFETGDTSGWGFGQSGTGGFQGLGSDVQWRAQGKYYETVTPGTGDAYIVQTVGGVHYGDVVMVSALMANSTSAMMQVLWLDSAGVGISWALGFSGVATGGGYGTTGPQRKSWKTGPAPAGTVGVNIYAWAFAGGGTLLVDDIWFSRVGDLVSSDGNVVIDSSGIKITNGKLTVTNPSSTVIIDGTSNMFKIAASGSMNLTQAANTNGSTSATLTGLGTMAAPLAHLSFVYRASAVNNLRRITPDSILRWGSFVAAASGGAATTRAIVTLAQGELATFINGSSQMVIELDVYNSDTIAQGFYAGYYVLKEAVL